MFKKISVLAALLTNREQRFNPRFNQTPLLNMPDYDEKEDLVDRLVALGRRKKGLSLDQLHRELPENMMSADDIEDVLERLEGANISVAETDAQLLERASNMALDDEEEEKEGYPFISNNGTTMERGYHHDHLMRSGQGSSSNNQGMFNQAGSHQHGNISE